VFAANKKTQYSRYIHAIQRASKAAVPFFSTGNPREIAKRVTSIAESSNFILENDYSKFDATLGLLYREAELKLLLLVFPDDELEIRQLHQQFYDLDVYHRQNVQDMSEPIAYHSTGRNSGEPPTKFFNDVLNGFAHYYGLRLSGLGHNEAYAFLEKYALFSGDDGLCGNYVARWAARAKKALGLKGKPLIRKRGEKVTFLARYYGPKVWFGSENSCCDIPRQLRKLHLTVTLPPNIDSMQKMRMKALGFWYTDRHTPVIGPWAAAVLKGAEGTEIDLRVSGWWAQFEEANQYPNWREDWMVEVITDALPDFEVDAFEELMYRLTFNEFFEPAREIELLTLRMFCERDNPKPAVLTAARGDILDAPRGAPVAKAAKKTRRGKRGGKGKRSSR
jgi:hypothetical protein